MSNKKGSLRLIDGSKCDVSGDGVGLAVLDVPQLSSFEEVDRRIRHTIGYTRTRVIFYNQDEMLQALNQEINKL